MWVLYKEEYSILMLFDNVIKGTLHQAMKDQRGNRGIAVLFL